MLTARKRSLDQGTIFAPVCHSVHRGGSTWSGTPPGQVHLPEQVHPPGRYTPLGRCTPWAGTPLISACWDTVNKRAVRILLECILVYLKAFHLFLIISVHWTLIPFHTLHIFSYLMSLCMIVTVKLHIFLTSIYSLGLWYFCDLSAKSC